MKSNWQTITMLVVAAILTFIVVSSMNNYLNSKKRQELSYNEFVQMVEAGEVDSMLNLKGESLADAYKVLEIEPSATDEEVRKAFRQLALKHHPDRVATLGEDVRRAAEEKFQQINNAKERIYKARGMK